MGNTQEKILNYDESYYIKTEDEPASDKNKTLEAIKQHIKYDSDKMKLTFEIEADDFESSEEWDKFKRELI